MTLNRYILGFGISLIITLGVFALVSWHIDLGHEFPPHELLYPLLAVAAIIQLLVQVIFFLHIGDEKGPRWNLLAFSFAGVVVVILVGGTLWIMTNLMHTHEMPANTPYIGNVVTPATEND